MVLQPDSHHDKVLVRVDVQHLFADAQRDIAQEAIPREQTNAMTKVFLVILFQRFNRTSLLAFLAKDAFCGVFPIAGVIVHLDLHGTDFQTLAALDALALVAMDTEQREVTHRFEEDRDGADVFTEGTVVLE